MIWLVFVAELAAILAVAPHRWRWVREHPLDPLIVLLTPPIMPSSLQASFAGTAQQFQESLQSEPMLVLTGKGEKTLREGGFPKNTVIFPDLAFVASALLVAD